MHPISVAYFDELTKRKRLKLSIDYSNNNILNHSNPILDLNGRPLSLNDNILFPYGNRLKVISIRAIKPFNTLGIASLKLRDIPPHTPPRGVLCTYKGDPCQVFLKRSTMKTIPLGFVILDNAPSWYQTLVDDYENLKINYSTYPTIVISSNSPYLSFNNI